MMHLPQDTFHGLAPYYDRVMAQVDYRRWVLITTALAQLLPEKFLHLDMACGTGTLLKHLRKAGWNSLGMDISFPMLQAGRETAQGRRFPVATADLRALPLKGCADYVTCLFDSVNFLLDREDLSQALSQIAATLKADGLFYFDVITERMVTEHFAGKRWQEAHGRFSTTWSGAYCPKTATVEVRIRVSSGAESLIRERVYSLEEISDAAGDAGLTLLGAYDAATWRRPSRKTLRIDVLAARKPTRLLEKPLKRVVTQIQSMVRPASDGIARRLA